MRAAQVVREAAPDWRIDPWGHLMGLRFDVQAALKIRGLRTDPTYRPGAGGPRIECEFAEEILMDLRPKELLRAAKLLERACARLRRHGKDY